MRAVQVKGRRVPKPKEKNSEWNFPEFFQSLTLRADLMDYEITTLCECSTFDLGEWSQDAANRMQLKRNLPWREHPWGCWLKKSFSRTLTNGFFFVLLYFWKIIRMNVEIKVLSFSIWFTVGQMISCRDCEQPPSNALGS